MKVVFGSLLCISLLALEYAAIAFAGDDFDDDDVAVPQVQQPQPMIVLTPEQFDQRVFGAQNGYAVAMKQFESQVDLRIEAADRVCKLTDTQKYKLRLAGDSDLKEFKDRCDSLKQRFQNAQIPLNDANKIFAEIQPLQQEWSTGLLGDASLFAKVFHHLLSSEQFTQLKQEETQRVQVRYRAKIKLAIATVENSIPLTEKQRESFEQLLATETKPPKISGRYDYYVIMVQASRLSDEKLKAIFDEPQMRALKQLFQQVGRIEQVLKQQGVLDDDAAAAPPGVPAAQIIVNGKGGNMGGGAFNLAPILVK